jgi:hypothetical protein
MNDKATLLATNGWKIIEKNILYMIQRVEGAIENADNFPEVRYNVGFKAALLSVLALPEQVLEDKPPETGEVSIANNPRAKTSFMA